MCQLSSFCQWTPDSIVHPGDSSHQAYRLRLDEMYEHVDLEEVPSGILYDYGISFITLDPFRGQPVDSIKASIHSFGFAYASLSSMVVSSAAALPNPSVYRSRMDTIHSHSAVISVAGMHQVYHSIDTNAIVNNQLEVIADNLYDVLPRTGSPYLEQELFMFAPAVHKIDGHELNLLLDSNLFFTNVNKTLAEIAIDFGNDSGYVATSFNFSEGAVYDSAGWQTITIRITYTDTSVYYSHFDVYVGVAENRTAGDNIHDLHHYITPINESNPEDGRGGGNIYVYLGCGHSRIEKPFIWAEGFNPQVGELDLGLSKEDAVARINHALTITDPGNPKTLWENLIENGYDIILIDYDDGGDYIARTAELIKQTIRWVNIQKHAAGSNEKNVIMGQSMGGVATNLALKEMEVVDEEDHEVATFVVFDSPVLGVNIPLGGQSSLIDIAFLPVDNDGYILPLKQYVPILDDGVNLLFTPAARTMIRYLYDAPSIPGSQHLWEDHYEYQWTTLGGYPTQCEVINIANGSILGEAGKQPFEAGEVVVSKTGHSLLILNLLAGHGSKLGVNVGEDAFYATSLVTTGGLIMAAAGVNIDVSISILSAPDGSSGPVYFSQVLATTFWGDINVFSTCLKVTSDKEGIDCAPGGFVGLGNQGIMVENFHLSGALEPDIFKLNTWCFTPTVSVLSYFDGAPSVGFNGLLHTFTDYQNSLNWLETTTGLKSYTSFDETVQFTALNEDGNATGVYPTEFYNTAHTWFTASNTKFMHFHFVKGADELSGLDVLESGTTYNYGTTHLSNTFNFPYQSAKTTTHIMDTSLTVSNTVLGVNTDIYLSLFPPGPDDPFGLTLPPVDNSSFLVTMGSGCDNIAPITLTIEDGASLILGDGDGRTGAMHVYDGHTIIIKDGGVLDIKEGSTLKLKTGSQLILESGSTVYIRNGAYLITEDQTNIVYHPGVEFHLLGNDAVLEMAGTLNLLADANFKPLHVGVASGLVVVKNYGLISGGANSSFEIIGDGENDFMLAIMEGARLSSDGPMEFMRISNCNVALRSGEWYNIRSNVPFYSNNTKYDAQPNMELTGHPLIYLNNKSTFANCTFNDVILHATPFSVYPAGPFLFIGNSEFTHTYAETIPFVRVIEGNFEIYGTTFTDFEGICIQTADMTSTSKLYNCTFNAGVPALGTVLEDESESEIRAQGNTINETAVGFWKSYGKLTLKCNTFDEVNNVNIYAGPNCFLEMSTGANAGYNDILASQPLGYNIMLDNAVYLNIKYGYNYFNYAGSLPGVYGTVQISNPAMAKQYIHAHKNQWNAGNTVPSPTTAELYSSITGNSIPLIMVDPESAACGYYDVHNPVVSFPSGTGIFPKVKTAMMADSMQLDSAFAEAFYLAEMFDSLGGNDSLALEFYHDILMSPYGLDTATHLLLDYGFYEMKATLEHCFATGRISPRQNSVSFSRLVGLYVDVLNARSETVIDESNYERQFNLELSKAHLFRLIDHTDLALDILYNTELCALDSAEQAILNHWKFVFEESIEKHAIGYAYDSIGVIITNTSGYIQPVENRQETYYFGSDIRALDDIRFTTCDPEERSMIQDDSTHTAGFLKLYPNPSHDGLITVEYELPEQSTGIFVVYTIDGKELYRFQCIEGYVRTPVDISFAGRGIYTYSYLVNGVVTDRGKFVIE